MPASAVCSVVVLILRLLAERKFNALKRRLAPVIDNKRTITITTTSSEIPRSFSRILFMIFPRASGSEPAIAQIDIGVHSGSDLPTELAVCVLGLNGYGHLHSLDVRRHDR